MSYPERPESLLVIEEAMLERWREEDLFRQTLAANEDGEPYVFYEGPPTANGRPGLHHVIGRTIKDLVCRYHAMQGRSITRIAGWDTHGLPVEIEAEKKLGISGKPEIEALGIAEFNRVCKDSVFTYKKEWEELSERVGYWLEYWRPYITFEPEYVESVWWILKSFADKDLLYRGHKSVPYCPRCGTTLSSHEVALGYKDVEDPSLTFVAELLDAGGAPDGRAMLAWTTTPWTVPSNSGLAVDPKLTYAEVVRDDCRYVVAEARVEALFGEEAEIVGTCKGADLVGLHYRRPLEVLPMPDDPQNGWTVVGEDFVSAQDGTGIVHMAPAFGADDYVAGQTHGLPMLNPIDDAGCFHEYVDLVAGQFVKDADPTLVEALRERGLLFDSGRITHSYPHCWRCESPLLYVARDSWFVRTSSLKDQLLANNEQVTWYPPEVGENRFGEWLRGNIDWALSRDRYWGTPLPVWVCDQGESHTHWIGSLADLAEAAGALPEDFDPHRPFIDELTWPCSECEGAMHRTPEVIDAWFDSGAMPFAQWHYPFENKDEFDRHFPADFISEGLDQTRGWFYSLMAISTLLGRGPCYRNVIVNDLILDADGQKMSKSKGNVVNPWEVMNEQGADALRWYLFTSAPSSLPRRFSAELVGESLRRFMLTLWNTYSFFVTYANIDGFDPEAHADYWAGDIGGPGLSSAPPNELDRWVISELNDLVANVTSDLDSYSPTDAGRRVEEFVDQLSNWYVRRGRRRYWRPLGGDDGGSGDDDKTWAYVTLYSCLFTLSKLMAPMTPFLADAMYRNLAPKNSPDSVHLTDFPKPEASLIDDDLDKATRLAMRIASLGRAARSKGKLKVRQPLARVIVRARPEEAKYLTTIADQVLEELNVKALEVAADDALATFKLRPNLPALGPKYGKQIGAIRAALAAVDAGAVATTLRGGGTVTVGEFTLDESEILVDVEEREGFAVSIDSSGGLMVGLDTDLTPELQAEGMAREIVHRIQNARKSAGLEIEDRITAYVDGASAAVTSALAAHDAYLRQETLSDDVRLESAPANAYSEEQDIEGVKLTLGVAKVG